MFCINTTTKQQHENINTNMTKSFEYIQYSEDEYGDLKEVDVLQPIITVLLMD
jgi:hypothetical protein